MISVQVKITEDRWKEVEAKLAAALAEVVTQTAATIKEHAVALVPVRTGRLRDSIEVEHSAPLAASVEVGAEYGLFVELGTDRMSPQPFLSPAADLERDSFYAAVEAVVRSVG